MVRTSNDRRGCPAEQMNVVTAHLQANHPRFILAGDHTIIAQESANIDFCLHKGKSTRSRGVDVRSRKSLPSHISSRKVAYATAINFNSETADGRKARHTTGNDRTRCRYGF